MNNKEMKPFILILIGSVLFLCCMAVSTVFLVNRLQKNEPTPTPRATQSASPTTTPQARNTPLPSLDVNTLDAQTLQSMREIETDVLSYRGLKATTVPIQILSPEQLRQRMIDELDEDSPEDVRENQAELSFFGIIPPDFDLHAMTIDLYSEQIAGFYDSEEKVMYVVSGQGFGGMERATYAHEYIHVLQDHSFDFAGRLGSSGDRCEEDSERCYALKALIEGDATLSEMVWFQYKATDRDRQEIQDFYANYSSPVLDSVPPALKADMSFPYDQGFVFVKALFDRGGYAEIDRAFSTQNPLSTEQILHPERYPGDKPMTVLLPDIETLSAGEWEVEEENTLGEWSLRLLLSKAYKPEWQLEEERAIKAAEGWGGDRYALLENRAENEYALLLHIRFDSATDENEAREAFDDYLNLRFPETHADGSMYDAQGWATLIIPDGEGGFYWLLTQNAKSLEQLRILF